MSYEVVDKDVNSNDIFTGGAADGRYAKATAPIADTTDKKTEKKKKAPKIEAEVKPAEEQSAEAAIDKPKTKKKPRPTDENITEAAASENTGDTSVKPKKKRAPKIEGERENIDPAVSTEVSPTTDEPVKKKKAKAPKPAAIAEDSMPVDSVAGNTYEEPIGDIVAPKVKKAKKPKQTAAPPPVTADEEMVAKGSDANNYEGFPVNPAMYDGNPMGTAEIPTETKQQSEYEQAITNAFSNLGNKINFTEYVGGDVWSIIHPPKTARMPNRSGIRKIIPGGSNRQDPRLTNGRGSLNPPVSKGGFFNRMKSTVTTLVRDENNLIFGEQSNYDVAYFEEEEEEGDTDNLHRYAQKLRELEDADREVNPEYIVIRGGKTVFGVQETDAEGKTILSKRKPIYDRPADQEIDGMEETGKTKLFGRLRHAFTKAKDRDGKGENSPKSSTGTPDSNEKNSKRKSSKKQNEEYAMTSGKEPADY